jgi:hypothetical protein
MVRELNQWNITFWLLDCASCVDALLGHNMRKKLCIFCTSGPTKSTILHFILIWIRQINGIFNKYFQKKEVHYSTVIYSTSNLHILVIIHPSFNILFTVFHNNMSAFVQHDCPKFGLTLNFSLLSFLTVFLSVTINVLPDKLSVFLSMLYPFLTGCITVFLSALCLSLYSF